jgi:hypothetical protein
LEGVFSVVLKKLQNAQGALKFIGNSFAYATLPPGVLA